MIWPITSNSLIALGILKQPKISEEENHVLLKLWKKLPDGAKFCAYCGKPITDEKQEDTTQDTLEDVIIPAQEGNDTQEKPHNAMGGEQESSILTSTKQANNSKMIIGIVLALIAIIVAIITILAIRSAAIKDFDYGGIVISIPDGYETSDFYSNRFDMFGTQESVIFEDCKNGDNRIQIVCFPGEWVPDVNGEMFAGFSQNRDSEIIDQRNFEVDRNIIQYAHYKTDYLGKTLYVNTMSIYFEDRWVNIVTNTYDDRTDKEWKRSLIQ